MRKHFSSVNYLFSSEKGIKNVSKKWLQHNFLILSGTGKQVIRDQGKGLKAVNSENYSNRALSCGQF